MAVHDWTRVEAGIFHDFHTVWIGTIRNALNDGCLPQGFYALAEQQYGEAVADILTLHANGSSNGSPIESDGRGGIAVETEPPKVHRRQLLGPVELTRRRTVAVRHVSNHRLVAVIEIASPANKDRRRSVEDFVDKAAATLNRGVHLLLADLFPPGKFDAGGLHAHIARRFDDSVEPYTVPADQPLTLASYSAGKDVTAWVQHLAVGTPLPDMPLFLSEERYINVPFNETYDAAYKGMPAYWKQVVEGKG